MSDLGLLYLVLIAFYLAECTLWARHGAAVFLGALGRRWTAARPSSSLGNASGGLVLAPFMPPLGAAVISEPWPLTVAPGGVLCRSVSTLDRSGVVAEEDAWLPFGAAGSVAAHHDGRAVWAASGARVVRGRGSTTRGPEQLSRVIARAAAAAPADRAAVLGEALDRAFDVGLADARWKAASSRARTLVGLAHVLWIELFLVAPLMFSSYAEAVPLWTFGAALAVSMASVGLAFYFAHRALFGAARGERWMKLVEVGLFPPAAVRAHDVLLRESMAEHHPLAVAAVLLDADRFAALAGRLLRDLLHPLERQGALAEAPAEAEAWLRRELTSRVEALATKRGVARETLVGPPSRSDPSSQSWCPRCRAEYRRPTGACDECPGVQTVPFA